MKIKPTLVAGSAVLLAAILMTAGQLAGPNHGKDSADVATAEKNSRVLRKSPRHLEPAQRSQNAPRKVLAGMTESITHWEARLRELEIEGNSREMALPLLMKELAKSFETRIIEEVLRLEDLPPLLRHGRMVDLQSSVGQETAAVIKHLGLDGEQHMAVTSAAMQPLWAELMYAGEASDPATRMGMMLLEKERLSRLKSAIQIADYDARQQAVTDLSGWHQAELEAVLGNLAVP